MFLIFLVYGLFASTFILGRNVVSAVPPIFFIGIRMVLASLLLGLFLIIQRKGKNKFELIEKKELPWFLGIIIFHIYGAYVAEYISLQYLTGAKVCLLYNLSPFITALCTYVFLKQHLSRKKWIGLLIGFGAFLPLLISDFNGATLFTTSDLAIYPECILLFSVVCAALGWIFMKKLTETYNYSYLVVNTCGMFFGGILALIHSSFVEIWPSFYSLAHNFPFLRGLCGLILIGNIICYNLYGYLLQRYSPTLLSFFGFCTPVFAALLGWIFLNESVNPLFFATIVGVFFGLYLFYQDELIQKQTTL